ncbi:hypothetical protein CAL29_08090 [Bordetella genomosp. 10]|uniref:Solute-binding protein family 3/N-terminal domain-containing protein n=1 Tax=Bordetella genomosp. 10 TaxID=1416804 RepID=A0A261SNA5_9BORD|nr:transporter substrate-binding domain-containing protein [Bordetella genomosp. 10]OZI38270.1 hypothetical protein CAL29_08090 [Bordetella genomosp. 10]
MYKAIRRTGAVASLCLAAVFANAPAQAQSAGDLQRIVDAKVVRVGAIEAPPWYHQDLLTNKWTGIVPETAEALFGYIGVKVEYVPTDWGTAVAGLQSNKFDLVGAFTATPARALAVDFSQSVGFVPTGVVSLKPELAGVKEWSALNKPEVKIAAVDGAATTRGVEGLLPKASWTLVKTNDAMLLELESGRADVAISNQPTLLQYVAAKKKGNISLPVPARGTTAPFALRKEANPQLRNWLDTTLQYAKADGVVQKIWEKYLPAGN